MTSIKVIIRKSKGGGGSGNWNHKGRPGLVGGSSPSKNSLVAVRFSTNTRKPTYNNYLPPIGSSAGDYITPETRDIIDGCTERVLANTSVNLSRLGLAVDSKMMPGNVTGYHQPFTDWREGKLSHIGVVVCTNRITGIGNPNIVDILAKQTGIAANYKSVFEHVLMHELGHEAYIQLPGRLKKSWVSQYAATKEYNTPYGKSDSVEGFCEMFAKYLNGYDVHPSISEWMDKNVRTTE